MMEIGRLQTLVKKCLVVAWFFASSNEGAQVFLVLQNKVLRKLGLQKKAQALFPLELQQGV